MSTKFSGGPHSHRIVEAGPAGVGADACPGSARAITELQAYLVRFRDRCRATGWWRSLFHVEVVQEIAADVVKDEQLQAQAAHRAEVLDLEARVALERGDRGKALRLISRSADLDHDISEALGQPLFLPRRIGDSRTRT